MLAKTNIINALVKIIFKFTPFQTSLSKLLMIFGIKFFKAGSIFVDLEAEFTIDKRKTIKTNNKTILPMSFFAIIKSF